MCLRTAAYHTTPRGLRGAPTSKAILSHDTYRQKVVEQLLLPSGGDRLLQSVQLRLTGGAGVGLLGRLAVTRRNTVRRGTHQGRV